MLIRIQATSISISKNEMLIAIGKKTFREIKEKNNRPFFQAYSIVQEGMSKPKILGGHSEKPIFWLREIIEKTRFAIKKGLQFFVGHNEDNSTLGRKTIGRVVGLITKTIKGKLNQIVIGYFPDKSLVRNKDVCSIEADVFVQSSENMDIATGVKSITAIALENSRNEKPGFVGSIRLATLQCFEKDISKQPDILDKNKGDKKMPITYEDFSNAPFDFFKRAMREKQIFPSQLGFTENDLRKDNNFSAAFIELDKLKSDNKSLTESFEKEKKERESDKLENQRLTSKTRLEKIIPEGYTDRQKSFVLETFDAKNIEDLSEDGLKQYLTKAEIDYKKYAKVFGVQEESIINQNDFESQSSGDRFKSDGNEDVVEALLDDILERPKEG